MIPLEADPLTGSRLVDLIVFAASVVGAVVTLLGALWWLLWPRVEDKLQAVIRQTAVVAGQLDPNTEGSTARHAKDAAEWAAEVPRLRERVESWERWRGETDRRISGLEGVLLALVGPELRRRLFEDPTDTPEGRET